MLAQDLLLGGLPGLLYSLIRLGRSYRGCPVYAGRTMVPLDSPVGRRMLAEAAGGNDGAPSARGYSGAGVA